MRVIRTTAAVLTGLVAMALLAEDTFAFSIGILPSDGTPVVVDGSIDSRRELDFYTFILPGDVNHGDGTYLNIQTFGNSSDNVDTEIGLYDSLGSLIAFDDDANLDGPNYIFYSLLSFGDSDPWPHDPDINPPEPGRDGTLVAGTYTLVVGGYNTFFGSDINDVGGGWSRGDYSLQFSSVTRAVSVADGGATALLLAGALSGLALLRRRSARRVQVQS